MPARAEAAMAPEPGGDEFEIIARHFAPLARTPFARGLIDDVALIEGAGDLIVTTDAIVEGVHFLADDPLDLVARKALRVNISDIAAKGGEPKYYTLMLLWPDGRDADDVAILVRGLDFDQRIYGVDLIGGDTARTPGPLTLAVTMLGAPLAGAPSRAGAKPGDDLWVTGTIGDGGLGLEVRRGGLGELDAGARDFLAQRYQLPDPRVGFAPILGGLASASCDVSDGLIADAGHIAATSDVALDIEAGAIPLSDAARAWAGGDEARIARLAAMGDDYEILFAAPAAARAIIAQSHWMGRQGVTRIGVVKAGEGARLIGASGPIALAAGGYAHRLGARAR
jgi:thiamine-monophosphate kinase